ncbi:MAG: Rpn family recombination-promoting nuclease/putative transposase [Acidobacteriota bacterium]|nr:Rpn family recombination-promoting nuclease/putative transposase [Acidobacteriota bacterium]
MPGKPKNPRDDFMRVAMSFKEVSVPLLEMCLDPELKEKLDLDQVELKDDTFISEDSLKKNVSELLFSIPDKNTGELIFIYLLMVPTTDGLEALTPTVEKCRQEAMVRYGDEENGTGPMVVPVVISLGQSPIPGVS